jgi:hypothetical protein
LIRRLRNADKEKLVKDFLPFPEERREKHHGSLKRTERMRICNSSMHKNHIPPSWSPPLSWSRAPFPIRASALFSWLQVLAIRYMMP